MPVIMYPAQPARARLPPVIVNRRKESATICLPQGALRS
jgi:hypothetical protein